MRARCESSIIFLQTSLYCGFWDSNVADIDRLYDVTLDVLQN